MYYPIFTRILAKRIAAIQQSMPLAIERYRNAMQEKWEKEQELNMGMELELDMAEEEKTEKTLRDPATVLDMAATPASSYNAKQLDKTTRSIGKPARIKSPPKKMHKKPGIPWGFWLRMNYGFKSNIA